MSTYTDPFGSGSFVKGWTIGYWACYFVYMPLMGVFNAKISKGRRLKEVAFGQLVLCTLGSWVSMATFGNYAMKLQMSDIINISAFLDKGDEAGAIIAIVKTMPASKLFMIGLCIVGMGLYVVSKYNRFTTHYVLVGIFKALVFYYMGYLCRKYDIFNKCILKKDLIGFFVTLSLSIVLFHYHANETYFPIHMLSYFPAVLFGLLAFIYFCKMLNGIRSNIVVNYSNGTMVFIGLHWMLTGFIRYSILKSIFGVSSDHIFSPWEAYALGLVVTLILYPVILLFQAKMPWMLGKRN